MGRGPGIEWGLGLVVRRRGFFGAFHGRCGNAAQAILYFLQCARQPVDLRLLPRHGIAQFLECVLLKSEARFQLNGPS